MSLEWLDPLLGWEHWPRIFRGIGLLVSFFVFVWCLALIGAREDRKGAR